MSFVEGWWSFGGWFAGLRGVKRVAGGGGGVGVGAWLSSKGNQKQHHPEGPIPRRHARIPVVDFTLGIPFGLAACPEMEVARQRNPILCSPRVTEQKVAEASSHSPDLQSKLEAFPCSLPIETDLKLLPSQITRTTPLSAGLFAGSLPCAQAGCG